jgi:Leucine-rich repeat (LRR) protein
LKNLKVLNLSTNKIENVLGGSFQGLTNLTLLDLSENKIKIFDQNISNQLLNLEEIILKSNQITSFNFSFVKLRKLDLSSNNLREFSIVSQNGHLSFLDISNNNFFKYSISNLLDNLLYFNASSMSEVFVSNFKFSSNTPVQSLDLSYNDLSKIVNSTFLNLKHLKKLYLKETNLNDFDFLLLTNQSLLEELDLSSNSEFVKSLHFFNLLKILKVLKLSNMSLVAINGIDLIIGHLIYLDLSYNNLRYFNLHFVYLEYFDLSFNSIEYLFESNLNEIKDFKINYPFLKSLNLIESLTQACSPVVLYFNKNLENAILTGNCLDNFPKFCQFCDEAACTRSTLINLDCRLITLKFDSNSLTKIMFEDLMDLNNLEYLNLENNRITLIETNSFSNLINLKTLILSRNQIVFCNETNNLFDTLSNLQLLNLSSNKIEFLSAYLFYQLYKLETLDLSLNRIKQLETESFFKLYNLKSLYLNENSPQRLIEKDAFYKLESIQNVFISKTILTDLVKEIFIKLFTVKNSRILKKSLNRSYFKSLFLSSAYTPKLYDCNLTLCFILRNVHFNFKTEQEIFDYYNECSSLVIKNSTFLPNEITKKNALVFTNALIYPFYFYLFCLFLLFLLLLKIF